MNADAAAVPGRAPLNFQYGEPAHGSLMLLRLHPREDRGQRILRFNLQIDPFASPTPLEDSFGNACHLFNIHRDHRQMTVHTKSQVETTDPPPSAGGLEKGVGGAGGRSESGASETHPLRAPPDRRSRHSPPPTVSAASRTPSRRLWKWPPGSTQHSATSREAPRSIHRSRAFWRPAGAFVRTTPML